MKKNIYQILNSQPGFTPKLLYKSIQGAWLEPISGSMWQENTGVTPTTTGGQTIGLLLDQSQGAVLGPELVTNGTFESVADGEVGHDNGDGTIDGWLNANGAHLSISSNKLIVRSATSAAYSAGIVTISLAAGKTYSITFDFAYISGNADTLFLVQRQTSPNTTYVSRALTANGTYSVKITPQDSLCRIICYATSSSAVDQTVSFDNISVKEILGNHASQSTAANRPVYGARRNLLTYSEQFDNAAWTIQAGTPTYNSTLDPNGTSTALKILETTEANAHRIYTTSAITITAGGKYTISAYLKNAGRSHGGIRCAIGSDGIRAHVDLTTGAVTTVIEGTNAVIYSAEAVPANNGFWRVSATFKLNNTSTTAFMTIFCSTGSPTYSYVGDVNYGIYIWGAQFELGSVATDYQKVTTATDFDPGQYPAVRHDATDTLTCSLPAINVRRNLLTYSEQFDNGAWIVDGSSVLANVDLSPNGIVTADKISELTTATSQHRIRTDAITIVAGSALTISAFIKAAERSFAVLRVASGSDEFRCNYNLSNGAYQTAAAGSGTILNASCNAVGNGWYRCVVSGIANSGSTSVFPAINVSSSISALTYAGIVGYGIYAWGAQLELGSVATDYQKVTDWTSEQFASSGSVYFATPVGLSAIHNQSIATSYNLPALQTDIYSWCVAPNRLTTSQENRLERYMLGKAGLVTPYYFGQEDYGPELVTNGTFDTDTTGWSKVGNPSLVSNSGKLVITYSSSLGVQWAFQSISVTIGNTYKFSFYAEKGTNPTGWHVRLGNTNAGTEYYYNSVGTPDGTNTILFTATASTIYVAIFPPFTTDGYSVYDNISVRELKDGVSGYLADDSGNELFLAQ